MTISLPLAKITILKNATLILIDNLLHKTHACLKNQQNLTMNEKLFNETFFKKNNYFRKELNLTQEQLTNYLNLIQNWLDRFSQLKQEMLAIKEIIDTIKNEIDNMLYKLYDLTPNEIETIETTLYRKLSDHTTK